MQDYPGLLVAVARLRLKQAVLARPSRRRLRLSVQEFWTLAVLRELPGISQSQLVERLRADAPTVSRTLAKLAARHLVRGGPDPADRRRTNVRLTAQGERVAAELAPDVGEIRGAVVAGMSDSEIAAVRRGLLHIIANLESLAAGAGAASPAKLARARAGRPSLAGRRAARRETPHD
jgi:DNA-binding MarR family transcriptional regulator